MKSFSRTWNSSKNPRKQRKYRYRAPLHLKRKMLAVHLPKDLRQKYKMRRITVRAGDKVKIIKGDFTGSEGKVERVDTKGCLIFVAGIEKVKKDGTKALIGTAPANMLIIELNTDDKRRLEGKKPVKQPIKETIKEKKEQKA